MTLPTFVRKISDRCFQYGYVLQAEDRRKDEMIKCGVTNDFMEAQRLAANIGRIWWVADSETELEKWRQTYVARGAVIESAKARSDNRHLIDVILALPKSRAEEILGYEPAEEEWLED